MLVIIEKHREVHRLPASCLHRGVTQGRAFGGSTAPQGRFWGRRSATWPSLGRWNCFQERWPGLRKVDAKGACLWWSMSGCEEDHTSVFTSLLCAAEVGDWIARRRSCDGRQACLADDTPSAGMGDPWAPLGGCVFRRWEGVRGSFALHLLSPTCLQLKAITTLQCVFWGDIFWALHPHLWGCECLSHMWGVMFRTPESHLWGDMSWAVHSHIWSDTSSPP